jgi:hypothetical protein
MAVHHGSEILLKVTRKSDYRVKANKLDSLDCHLGIHCVRLGSLFKHSGVNTSPDKGMISSDIKKTHTHEQAHIHTHESSKLRSTVFHKYLVNSLNKIIIHHRWPTTLLFIVNICSPIFEHSTLSYGPFTHYILAVNCHA